MRTFYHWELINQNFLIAIIRYLEYGRLSRFRKVLVGDGWQVGEARNTAFYRYYEDLHQVFTTPAGCYLLSLHRSHEKLLSQCFKNGLWIGGKLPEHVVEECVSLAKLMRDLWVVAHHEAGLLVDEATERAALNEIIADAKAYLAAKEELSMVPNDALSPDSTAGKEADAESRATVSS